MFCAGKPERKILKSNKKMPKIRELPEYLHPCHHKSIARQFKLDGTFPLDLVYNNNIGLDQFSLHISKLYLKSEIKLMHITKTFKIFTSIGLVRTSANCLASSL